MGLPDDAEPQIESLTATMEIIRPGLAVRMQASWAGGKTVNLYIDDQPFDAFTYMEQPDFGDVEALAEAVLAHYEEWSADDFLKLAESVGVSLS